MRKRTLFISLFLLLAAWAAAFLTVFFQECQLPQDAVAVNEVLQTVQDGWEDLAGGRAGGEAGSGESFRMPGRKGAEGADSSWRMPFFRIVLHAAGPAGGSHGVRGRGLRRLLSL